MNKKIKKQQADIVDITEMGKELIKKRHKVPIHLLSETIVFPYTLSPLVIEGAESINMIEKASSGDRLIGLFPKISEEDNSYDLKINEILKEAVTIDGKMASRVGTLGRIVKMLRCPDGSVRVLIRGLSRIRFIESNRRLKDNLSFVEKVVDEASEEIDTVAMARNAINQFQKIISFSPNFPDELKVAVLNVDDNVRMIDMIADTVDLSFAAKLHILNYVTLKERLQMLTILLNREVEVLQIGSKIQSQVHNAFGKTQREGFLREQLATIKKELGEENANPDITTINERLAKVLLPENVVETIKKEIERLEMIPPASGEYHVVYTYIDWLLSLPWNIYTEDRLNIADASKILNADHYGLEDVKEIILEFLSVLQLKKDRKSPIICFVGPPGVGKTSLGKSIAKAMGREFVRISLGGIRDEAEIRGHRRTYIGALPGRLIQGLKRAKSNNPVFMLDEIDKIGNDFRGDPSSALLEVLDPHQNNSFNDHFLELGYDLSSVMFIATANILDTIPAPLIDRMEIIRLPGYTALEKKQIAKRFLIPRQIKENGLKRRQLSFPMGSIDEIINYYTREAGVRNLERTIGSVCRKIARKLVEGVIEQSEESKPTPADIQKLLGHRKFFMDEAEREPEIGVATGMAWTSSGGSILPIEATMMAGKGVLHLTGSLGNVMKESAQTAFSYIKSSSKKLKIKDAIFEKHDFHVHVPDGATPKDGPSAGVTIVTALVSLLTNKPVKPKTSMTGEITLRGKVTPIGGVKEKVIAALRSGITTVIIPSKNEKDLEDIPIEVRKKIKFVMVDHVEKVLKFML